ncbi:MAG: phosphonate ABC transporter substrate-binding protein [Pseudomonadota bacterium]
MTDRVRAAILTLAFSLAVGAAQAQELNFGLISTESSPNLAQTWDPFIDAMSAQTGLTVKAFYAPDYAGVIEAMGRETVDLAWFGNKSAITAVDRSGGEVFAQSVDASGNPGYWSVLVTHKDSGLTYQDVLTCDQSLAFGNGDPQSTSGFLVPSYYIFAQNNVEPRDCYKTVTNATHEANLFSVAEKRVDFATSNSESLGRFEKNAPEIFDNIKEIWRSPLIPSDPIVWRKSLDQGTKDQILSFFMRYGRIGTEEEVKAARAILADLEWAPFRPSSNAQLYPVRQLQLFADKLNAQADGSLSAQQKKQKITEIDAQLKEISRLASQVPQL